jgi:hypothetical protein
MVDDLHDEARAEAELIARVKDYPTITRLSHRTQIELIEQLRDALAARPRPSHTEAERETLERWLARNPRTVGVVKDRSTLADALLSEFVIVPRDGVQGDAKLPQNSAVSDWTVDAQMGEVVTPFPAGAARERTEAEIEAAGESIADTGKLTYAPRITQRQILHYRGQAALAAADRVASEGVTDPTCVRCGKQGPTPGLDLCRDCLTEFEAWGKTQREGVTD